MRWEYLIVDIDKNSAEKTKLLNGYGSSCWELVTVLAVGNNERYVLKRPVA